MAKAPLTRNGESHRQVFWRAFSALIVAVVAIGSVTTSRHSAAQKGPLVSFPERPKGQPKAGGFGLTGPRGTTEQMLVRADEIHYDHTNERVSAVGNVQIYHGGTSLEADKVIYDQKTKRVHAEGNVRMTEPDGRVSYGHIFNLSDDFRDGFVDSLRVDSPDQTRMAATRADRDQGNITVFHSGVYTACEPCADDPRKPPKWQVKAARVIHDKGEQMMYFESAALEFFGFPIAVLPYFSTPDPTAKRKTGVLMPTSQVNSQYGYALTVPYYWALAPNYDFTLTPMITTRQGALVQGEWRHRLVNGSYTIRASGIFQLDKKAYEGTPGERDFRGDVHSSGQFRLSDKWVWGWDGTVVSDKNYYQDYGFFKTVSSTDLLRRTPDHVRSQVYLQGTGQRSFFDIRAMYFYGFTALDNQKEMPVVHPVINHFFTVDRPVPLLGGELSVRNNLTSLSRQQPDYEAITLLAMGEGRCLLSNPDTALKIPANCILRGVPGHYTRASSEAHWRRTLVDSFGQVFTPFVNVRGDLASLNVNGDAGVSNFIATGQHEIARAMPTAGVEYRYPFINVQTWGTQTVEPVAQLVMSPNETKIGSLPNEDSQSFIFDASNLFRINKFAGWDRVEGGGRLNTGMQYTAQFNRGGYVNVLVGQSYHLLGQNSFTVGGTTNTGLDSGLDKARSDYVARVTYQPNNQLTLTSRFRFDEHDLSLQRAEYEAVVAFERWSGTVMYGNYKPQPALGFLDEREGVTATLKFKASANWLTFGGVRYDLKSQQLNETQIGVGYIDDCLILALNYITEYRYNTIDRYNHTVMMQLGLRTIGNFATRQGIAGLSTDSQGISR